MMEPRQPKTVEDFILIRDLSAWATQIQFAFWRWRSLKRNPPEVQFTGDSLRLVYETESVGTYEITVRKLCPNSRTQPD